MLNIESQSKGKAVTVEQINLLFDAYNSVNDRILYLLDVYNQVNNTNYTEGKITTIGLDDNMVVLSVESRYIVDDYLSTIYVKFDVELFTNDDTFQRYVEQAVKDAKDKKEKMEQKQKEKNAATKLLRKNKKLEKARNLLAKNGFTIMIKPYTATEDVTKNNKE
jgi:hypothetical protein